MTQFSRRTYATLAVVLGIIAALSLLGILRLPTPLPAMLFTLNTVLLVRVTQARRAARAVGGRDH